MNEDEPNKHSELVPIEHGALAMPSFADNKILSEMVGASLVLAKGVAVAHGELSVRGLKVQRILILDDDDVMRELLREMLESACFEVVTVPDFFEGIRVVFDGSFDVVICDWFMPVVNGDAFYREVEAVNPELCERFIFMTMASNQDLPSSEFGQSIQEFIQQINGTILFKPFKSSSMLDAVSGVLRRKSLRGQCPSKTSKP